MIYFDNAATGGRKPDEVISAVSSALRVCANPGRSGHNMAAETARQVYGCREKAAALFGCQPEKVVFTFHAAAAPYFSRNSSACAAIRSYMASSLPATCR